MLYVTTYWIRLGKLGFIFVKFRRVRDSVSRIENIFLMSWPTTVSHGEVFFEYVHFAQWLTPFGDYAMSAAAYSDLRNQ